MKIKMLEWAENLQRMDDKQVQKFAKSKNFNVTVDEVKKLRKIFRKASLSWGVYGIPKEALKEIEAVLGKKRLEQLREIIGI